MIIYPAAVQFRGLGYVWPNLEANGHGQGFINHGSTLRFRGLGFRVLGFRV